MFKGRSLLFTLAFLAIGIISCQKDVLEKNKVPVSEAGDPQTTTLPADSITLTGTGIDADGKVVAYLWSQVSGPGVSKIINPGSPTTLVKDFKIPGNYVFQLMVTDDEGATGVDTVAVQVNPAVIQTLTLQPANNPNEMQLFLEKGVDLTDIGGASIQGTTWTKDGGQFLVRGLLKFDLSSIPNNATIVSANLYLYSNPNPISGNFVDANYGSTNSLLVQQVATNWSPSTITFANQPAGISSNQILVPQTSETMKDLTLDVKDMVTSMVHENANYGFLLKLQNEQPFNCRIFVGSYNSALPEKHPRLVVVYKP